MNKDIKFTGEEAIVSGIKLKRIGNAAFRMDTKACVGNWFDDVCLNRLYIRMGDIDGFKDTVELEPGIYACTLKLRDGTEHFIFEDADANWQIFVACYDDTPDFVMQFHDANGSVDMFAKLVSGEVPLTNYRNFPLQP